MVGFAISSKSQARILWRLSCAHFLVDSFGGFMLPLLPMLALTLGFNKAAAGTLIALSGFTSSMMQPLYGQMSDSFQRRGININLGMVGITLSALTISFIGWVNHLSVLYVILFIGYLGIGIFHPVSTIIINSLETDHKNFIMSFFYGAGTMGFAFGPFISSFLVEHYGIGATIWYGLVAIPGLCLMWGISRSNLKKPATVPVQNTPTLSAPHVDDDAPFTTKEKGLLALLSSVGVLRAATIVGMQTFMVFYWTDLNYSLTTIGSVIALSTLVGGPSAIYGGRIADRIGEKNFQLLTLLPCLVLMPVILTTQGMVSFTLFVVMLGLLFSAVASNLVIGFREIPKKTGLVSGLINGVTWGGAGLLMPTLGSLSDQWGVIHTLQWVLYPILFVGFCLTMFIPARPDKRTCFGF